MLRNKIQRYSEKSQNNRNRISSLYSGKNNLRISIPLFNFNSITEKEIKSKLKSNKNKRNMITKFIFKAETSMSISQWQNR